MKKKIIQECDPIWAPVARDSFGDQKYVTTEMLSSFCQSLSYLKGVTEDLEDNTDPVVAKTLRPTPMDDLNSYGMVKRETDDNYEMSNSTYDHFEEEFNNPEHPLIDPRLTTCYIDNIKQQATLTPTMDKEENNTVNDGPNHDMHLNQYWCVC